jgi:hypothetical protein
MESFHRIDAVYAGFTDADLTAPGSDALAELAAPLGRPGRHDGDRRPG